MANTKKNTPFDIIVDTSRNLNKDIKLFCKYLPISKPFDDSISFKYVRE